MIAAPSIECWFWNNTASGVSVWVGVRSFSSLLLTSVIKMFIVHTGEMYALHCVAVRIRIINRI